MQQKLVSIDVEFSGMVAEVRGYRVDAIGATHASVVLEAPGAWYSGFHAVDVKNEHLRLVAAT
jgi:hypothetical protein